MHKPPVFYTLIQVKFNPVQMERFVPDFREALRASGYPDYEEERQVELRFQDPSGDRPPEQRQRKLWRFLDMERVAGFTLLDDALVYHTNHYERFALCREASLKALKALHDLVGLAYVDRVGMRYLDAIMSMNGEPLSKLVKPALLGVHEELPGKLKHSFSETSKMIDGGRLVLRVLVNDERLVVPPDLNNPTLNLAESLSDYQGPVVMMDSDYFVEKRYTFDMKAIEEQFDNSHAILIEAFKAAVTQEAKALWHLS